MDVIKNLIKKISLWGWLAVASAVLALIGMIIYGVTSTTGYIALLGVGWNVAPIICSVLAIVIVCALVFYSDKLGKWGNLVLYVVFALLILSFVYFLYGRIDYFEEVYFLPLEPPAEEVSALNSSIAGMVFYVFSIVAIIVAAFGKKLYKED